MKILYKIFAIAFIILLIPNLKLKGSGLFVSENKKTVSSKTVSSKIDENLLNSFYSTKPLGSYIENNKTIFRLFAPTQFKVVLEIFDNVDDSKGKVYQMEKDVDGVWEIIINENLNKKYYGYRVYSVENINNNEIPNLIVDPYSKAVATFTDYFNPRKSIVYQEEYDWENDEWIQRDRRDLTIYEMHIRDLTAHKSSKTNAPGTYQGLIDSNSLGGLNYIKSLGVNTVELLPAQEYGYVEIPYNDSLNGRFNTWNPYERNHWGYMTSNYFAPAGYYAEDIGVLKRNQWIGKSGDQVSRFKDMVKAFHKQGIAVMMDVVYNHLSEYELGNLKEIDKDYYFRLNKDGEYIAESYCGNDLKTERPMVRRLIVDSILYWMKEYHIDGFRFDLGKLIDWRTVEAIIYEAKKINPHVIFVCEPWGGGYDPKGFSLRDWGRWNDQIRNGIKGENPFNGLGWIFGNWYGNNDINRIQSYVRGTLIKDKYGLFQQPEHSVNYLESHDGYTLGDFIRLGLKKVKKDEVIKDVDTNIKLTDQELKLNKLAALFLFTSQGITMIHEGQEFARSKVIAFQDGVKDDHFGMLDHNSYNKDNETNYLNFEHAKINSELVSYYKGLIKLRNIHEAFRRADYNDYTFIDMKKELTLAYKLNYENKSYFVAFNANPKSKLKIKLPNGWWHVLADEDFAMSLNSKSVNDSLVLNPSTGVVLMLK